MTSESTPAAACVVPGEGSWDICFPEGAVIPEPWDAIPVDPGEHCPRGRGLHRHAPFTHKRDAESVLRELYPAAYIVEVAHLDGPIVEHLAPSESWAMYLAEDWLSRGAEVTGVHVRLADGTPVVTFGVCGGK